jgi:hypothetical protein
MIVMLMCLARIWEKKYGTHAKHLVKARSEQFTQGQIKPTGEARQWGRPMKGTVRERTESAAAGGGSGARTGGGAGSTAGGLPAGGKELAAKDKGVHPSWEAAKLRKRKEGVVNLTGEVKPTKIVFD